MLYALEKLDLKHFLLRLHDIDGSVTELIREGMIDLCAGEKQRLCNNSSVLAWHVRSCGNLLLRLKKCDSFKNAGWAKAPAVQMPLLDSSSHT